MEILVATICTRVHVVKCSVNAIAALTRQVTVLQMNFAMFLLRFSSANHNT